METRFCTSALTFVLLVLSWNGSAEAQVKEVVVGITTTCPYENAIEGGCWSGAYFALSQLPGVKSVDKKANGYTCTARVYPKNNDLPDPAKWATSFKESVDQTYIFRGVEVTVNGTIENEGGDLKLIVPGVNEKVKLVSLKHKLQWNSRKHAARQPEPDERDAYEQLSEKLKNADAQQKSNVHVTGPLEKTASGHTIEVREFFLPSDELVSNPAK